jgi:hypothetical protein
MKKLLSICGALLFLGTTALTLSGSLSGEVDENARDRFVGAWRLVSLEAQGSDGKVHQTESVGLLFFTRDGHMSVQVMERNPPAQTAAEPEKYSQGGYEASFGTYNVDTSTHTFTFHVEGALVRTLVGKDLPRSFELLGKQMIVKSTRTDEHWRAVWEHY